MGSRSLFAASYNEFGQYPLNHPSILRYGKHSLTQHRKQLWACKKNLFASKDTKIKLPIRDISATGDVNKINLFDNEELGSFLRDGTKQRLDGGPPTADPITFREDARCRFVFLCAETTVGPLEVNASMLLRLMSFYQVMPPYLDFLYAYGSSHGQDKELHFSGFKTEKTLINPVAGSDVSELGRSGRKYQMCYNLKTAAPKQDNNWKIRQAAVHHQFDVGKGTQLWIVADPHAEIKERVGELYRDNHAYPTSFSTMEQGFKSSMDVHFIYAQWATTNWRWNLRFLEEKADQLTLVTSMVNEESQMQALDPGSLGGVQRWEEKVNSTLMAMESNVKIMKLIQKFYKDLVKDEHFPQRERRACQSAVKDFVFQLEELICETQMQVSRAQVLLKILSDRKTILIQHLQARTALISSKLTAVMYKQAERSAMEAIAVRIVTIVTLIYLPATFSSTFFSTDVVKYQGGEMFDQTALDRFLQVTLPLMFLTFVPAGSWFWYERRNINKKSKHTEGQFNDLFTHEKDITNLK